MKLPAPLSGGCQCGEVRYRINSAPKTLYACHCTDCQKQSSSAFGMSLIVDATDLEFTTGQDSIRHWDTRGEDGALKRCAFCEQCGTRLYHAGEDGVLISVKAGSLDETRWLKPVAHIWLRSAQPWLNLATDRLNRFETEPDDRALLNALWQDLMRD